MKIATVLKWVFSVLVTLFLVSRTKGKVKFIADDRGRFASDLSTFTQKPIVKSVREEIPKIGTQIFLNELWERIKKVISEKWFTNLRQIVYSSLSHFRYKSQRVISWVIRWICGVAFPAWFVKFFGELNRTEAIISIFIILLIINILILVKNRNR